MTEHADVDQLCINTLRFLAADAVQKANSGHPGTPMGAAPLAYALWDRVLKHNPHSPNWPDRDRFVLSPGHASMLLYGLLHLTGYDLPMSEIENFRQWGSKTPGHPEYAETPGVEVTTGPLGQGLAHAVGMAVAERWLAGQYNRSGHEIIDHLTYALVSDGDMQEGVAAEAASLAGTLRLGKLIFLYDANDVQIEGSTELAFTEDVSKRFDAYGWHVVGPIDGHDPDAVEAAVLVAQAEVDRPSLVVCKTIIGFGSPAQGTAKVHGEPLGEDELRTTKQNLNWPVEPAFHVPPEVKAHMGRAATRGQVAEQAWQARFAEYSQAFPAEASQLAGQLEGGLPIDWDSGLTGLFADDEPAMATREASGKALNALAKNVGELVGGSADLAPSTKTTLVGYDDFGPSSPGGRNLHFGVREHAMGAITNGMALHGGVIPYSATFLQFADYMRPPIRLAALMGIRAIYVFTHDSIGLGEDGPTHQPVEHLLSLRAIPNLTVIRPADALETAEAWRAAILNDRGPTALVLSRQALPIVGGASQASGLHRGAYVIWQADSGQPDAILLGSGSETQLALEAGKRLADDGINASVVSMPSWELFDKQPTDYRDRVLPPAVRVRVAVEAAATLGWEHYVGLDGTTVGMTGFGASAPAGVLYREFGITADAVESAARQLLSRNQE